MLRQFSTPAASAARCCQRHLDQDKALHRCKSLISSEKSLATARLSKSMQVIALTSLRLRAFTNAWSTPSNRKVTGINQATSVTDLESDDVLHLFGKPWIRALNVFNVRAVSTTSSQEAD